jgi:hypothetical protein
MKTKKILFSFCRYNAPNLIIFGRSVVTKMTGNANFTTPDPALANVTAAIDDFEIMAAIALDGSKKAKSNMKESRKKLIALLRSLVLYVEKIAAGDENILISSGFEVSKDPKASQRDAFFVLQGVDSGSVTIGCIAYPKAGAYLWFRSAGKDLPVTEKDWLFVASSTQRKMLLSNLAPGQTFWFICRAVTPQGIMEWSDPIHFYVQ